MNTYKLIVECKSTEIVRVEAETMEQAIEKYNDGENTNLQYEEPTEHEILSIERI